jgi:uncharacterized membrane protein YbhN (UPF0104 family)
VRSRGAVDSVPISARPALANAVPGTEPPRPLVRSPVYVWRALVGASVMAVASVSLLVFENGLLGVRRDVASWQEGWPDGVVTAIELALGLPMLAAIVATNVVLLVRRRFRRWVMVNAAAVTAVLLGAAVSNALLVAAPSDALARAVDAAGEEGLGNDLLASLVAVLTVSSVWIGPRLKPWAVGSVVAAAGLSLVGGSLSVVTLPFDTGLGMVSGALVALALKTRDRTPTPTDVAVALGRTGIAVDHVERASVDARGSVPWFVTTAGGEELFVKTLGSDQRAADLLFRLYRLVRLQGAGDRRPFSSLRRAVEHEAFLSLAAEARGARTPQLVTVAEVGTDGMLVAYRRIEGRSLDAVDPAEISDRTLVDVWRLVASLRRVAIAHRDLRLANIFAADDGVPWIIDFGFAELAADDALLARDTAELLASTTAVVGSRRSVAAAQEIVGAAGVADALPWIQPLALSSETRDRMGGPEACARLRATAARAVGAGEVDEERIERVRPRTAVAVGSVVVALYVVAAQLAALGGLLDGVREAWVGWVALAVLASAATYLGAALGLRSVVPVRLRLGPVVMAQVAASFSNRISAAKVGGMPTTVRFLQRQDLSRRTAMSAVGLTSIGGVPVHLALLVLAAAASRDLDQPPVDPRGVAIVAALVMAAGGLMLLPAGRGLLTAYLMPAVRAGLSSLGGVARTPGRPLVLLIGAALVTLGDLAAMIASLAAVGADVPLARAALVYLGGAALAAVAPTPGGVGAVEVVLVAGYAAVGVAAAPACAAVLLFRLVSFWVPLVPGWLALRTPGTVDPSRSRPAP